MFTAEDIAAIPLFAGLPREDHERVAQAAADLHLRPGEYAVHEGEERALFAVLAGKIEVIKRIDGVERTLGWRLPAPSSARCRSRSGPRSPAPSGPPSPRGCCGSTRGSTTSIAAVAPAVAVAVGTLARERLGGLQGLAAKPPKPQSPSSAIAGIPTCHDLRRFIARNQMVFDWLTPDSADLAARWPG